MSIARSGLPIVNQTFLGNTKAALLNGILENLVSASWTNVWNTPSGGSGQTITVTIASPCVLTLSAGNAPAEGSRIILQTTGALPSGLSAGTNYYVRNPSGTTCNLSTTPTGSLLNTSGSQSGTHTANFELLLQTATTPSPQSLNMRFRFRDNNGNCVTISMERTDGAVVGANDTTNGVHMLPGTAKTFRLIAGAYYFWLLVPGSYGVAREFGFGGVPWIPSFLASGVVSACGYLCGNCVSDSSTDGRYTFRNSVRCNNWDNTPNQQLIHNLTLIGRANYTGQGAAFLQPFGPHQAAYCSSNYYCRRFIDGSFSSFDPWIAWSVYDGDYDPRIRGMLWDAVFVLDPTPGGDTVATFDGNTWTCISNLQSPSLWVISA
jgi:hypothetical protein